MSALRPYTNYQFKVIFEFSKDLHGIETQPSLIVRTKADLNIAPSRPTLKKVEQVSTQM